MSEGGAMAMLEVENLSRAFGALWAVNNVSFNVNEGEIVGLIGPNGSGKSTVFHLITGLLKPNNGMIRYNGKDITKLKTYQISQAGIARTFQIVKPFSEMSTLKNVMVGRAFGSSPGHTMEEIESDSLELLSFTALSPKSTMIAGRLGLVYRKKLELARALATKPKLLLLDEVMAGLNPTEMMETVEFLKTIQKTGVTMIVVEHVIKALFSMVDRVVVLSAGEKIADGSPQDIVCNEEVIRVYLGDYNYA
jgi:branched-chain amino acid transport system ATP-binding protein